MSQIPENFRKMYTLQLDDKEQTLGVKTRLLYTFHAYTHPNQYTQIDEKYAKMYIWRELVWCTIYLSLKKVTEISTLYWI